MFLSLNIPWLCIDATGAVPTGKLIAAGRYEVERIQNPFGYTNHSWIVLKGTRIGAPEAFWQAWQKRNLGDFTIRFEERPPDYLPQRGREFGEATQ